MIDINELTLGQVRELQQALGCISEPQRSGQGHWKIGTAYLVRTVTYFCVGTLVDVTEHELWFRDACWVPETGRFSEALKSGNVSEAEPFPDGLVALGRGAIVDACEWKHAALRVVR